MPLAKMYEIGEGSATPVEVERSATGLRERYEDIVKRIEEAKFTGKGDQGKVRPVVAEGMRVGLVRKALCSGVGLAEGGYHGQGRR